MSANAGALKGAISGSPGRLDDIPLGPMEAAPAALRERHTSPEPRAHAGVLANLESSDSRRVETRGPHVRPSVRRGRAQGSQPLPQSGEPTAPSYTTQSSARVMMDSAASVLRPQQLRAWAWEAFVAAVGFFASERTHVTGVDSLHTVAALNSSLPLCRRDLATTIAQSIWQPAEAIKALPAAIRNWAGAATDAALGTLGSTAATLLSPDPAAIDTALRKRLGAILTSGFRTLNTSRAPSDILKHMASPTAPIATFWTAYAELDGTVTRSDDGVLRKLDVLADTDDKRLTALALAFSFEGAPGRIRDERVRMRALDLLQGEQLIDDAVRWVEHGGDESEMLALSVLCVAAKSDEFPDMLRLLGHDVGDGLLSERTTRLEGRIDRFRALLRAHAAQCGIAPGSAATGRSTGHADERGSLQAEFERNVRAACALSLAGGDAALSVDQEVDLWVWLDGDVRDVSERKKLADALAVLVDVLGASDDERSPLDAAHFGLGGANYGRLADETARVRKLPDAPLVKALVQALHHAVHDRLGAMSDDVLGEEAADAQRARLIAELVALGIWTSNGRQGRKLEDNDIVRGRTYDLSMPDTLEAEQVEQWCDLALRSAAGTSGGARASLVPERNARRVRALVKQAGDALATVRMSLLRLGELAVEYGIGDDDLAGYCGEGRLLPLADFMDRARGVIEGVNTKPTEEGIEAAVQLLHGFCSGLQSGNRIALTQYRKGGVKSDGVAVNIAGAVGLSDAEHNAVLVRPKLGVERAAATEFQEGMSTESGWILMGGRTTSRGHVGGGAQYGRSWGPDEHAGLGRLAGGADFVPYAVEHSVLKGFVLRYPRRIVRLDLEASPPVYEHNESQIRQHLAQLQSTLREIAVQVKAEQRRAAQAGEAFNVGEAVLRRLAREGLRTRLSIGLVGQTSKIKRAEVSIAAGASVTTSQHIGMRFGANGNVTVERVLTTFEHEEEGGSVNVKSERIVDETRVKRAASAGANPTFGSGGAAPTDFASHSQLLGVMGASTSARRVERRGKLEPSASYTEAGFRDLPGYERYIKTHRDELIDVFSLSLAGDKGAASAELDKHLRAVKAARSTSHDNSARNRLNQSFADALNRLRGLLDLVPPRTRGSEKFIAELERKCAQLAEAKEATRLDSAITFAPLEESQAVGQTVAGVTWGKGLSRLSMRELMLYRPSWAWLRLGEKQRSAHVDPSGAIVPRDRFEAARDASAS